MVKVFMSIRFLVTCVITSLLVVHNTVSNVNWIAERIININSGLQGWLEHLKCSRWV